MNGPTRWANRLRPDYGTIRSASGIVRRYLQLPIRRKLRYLVAMVVVAKNPAWEPVLGYDDEKAVQCISYFIRKSGGRLEKLKVIKLLYLADRLSLTERGKPLNFDEYFSMPHGPVTSASLNGINGGLSHPSWKLLTLRKDGRTLELTGDAENDRLIAKSSIKFGATLDTCVLGIYEGGPTRIAQSTQRSRAGGYRYRSTSFLRLSETRPRPRPPTISGLSNGP